MAEITFPAVLVGGDGSFQVVSELLTSCTHATLGNGFFDGLRIVDSSGCEWVARAVVPQRAPGLLDRLLNRRISVKLDLLPPRNIAVSELAERLCSCVDGDPNDLYDQFMTHDELKAWFRAAGSFPELIARAGTLGAEFDPPDPGEE